MVNKIVIIGVVFLVFAGLNLKAQTEEKYSEQDPKAKVILDKLSEKNKSHKTIVADFTSSLINESEGLDIVQKGKIKIKGKKYFLTLDSTQIFSDGSYLYTYSKESNEVYKNNLPEKGEIDPSNLFTIYEKGFKYYLKKDDGTNQHIMLYPLSPGKHSYHTVELIIDKTKVEVKKVVLKGKEGNTYSYDIKSFTANTDVEDNLFIYSANRYVGSEMIDLSDE